MRSFRIIIALALCAGSFIAQARTPGEARAGSRPIVMSASVPAQQAPQLRRDWAAEFRQMLQGNVLKFWIDHAVDHEFGGVLGRLDRQGSPIPPGDKSLVLISRTLWSFAEAYRRYPDPQYREVAMSCLRFLREHFQDRERGGYYFMVTRDGHPVDTTKLLNPMSYTMEGLAETALAFHDAGAAREALELFRIIDRVAHDSIHGGYRMAYTADWQYIEDYSKEANAGSFGRKSMDWHLGLLEAFATLYDITGDATVRARLGELLDIFTDKIVDPDQGYGRLFFTRDWKPYNPGGAAPQSAYGLDLEASWLITESAKLVGRVDDPKTRRVVLALVDHALKVGFDGEHGGVYGSGPASGPVIDKTKSWWEQADGLVAFLNTFQMTGDQKYRDAFEKQAVFVTHNFVDREFGEWYTSITAEGQVNAEKAGPWKAPYHVTRALLEVISRLGRTL
jgi:mannobiose 2-epimerase